MVLWCSTSNMMWSGMSRWPCSSGHSSLILAITSFATSWRSSSVGMSIRPLWYVWRWEGHQSNNMSWHQLFTMISLTRFSPASFPGLHAQLLLLALRKAGERPGRIYHVMHAAADVMFSLLSSGFVLFPSLFFPWIQFVLSVQFFLRVRLLLDRSWLATVCDVSRGTHHVINPSRPSPAFCTASDKSWAWRPGNEATSAKIWRESLAPKLHFFLP